MKLKATLALLGVVVVVNSASAQSLTYVDGMPYINGEPFNGYRNDHADAYMAMLNNPQKHWEALAPKPSKITTLSFTDTRQNHSSLNYLILWDDVASWPSLVRIIPEDLSKPEKQFIVAIPKGRRVTVDLGVYQDLHNTNFAVIVSFAEDQNSATLTTYIEGTPHRQKPDVRITEVK